MSAGVAASVRSTSVNIHRPSLPAAVRSTMFSRYIMVPHPLIELDPLLLASALHRPLILTGKV
jgi:hypothetical protein